MLGKKDFGMKEKELDGVFIHSFWIFFFFCDFFILLFCLWIFLYINFYFLWFFFETFVKIFLFLVMKVFKFNLNVFNMI